MRAPRASAPSGRGVTRGPNTLRRNLLTAPGNPRSFETVVPVNTNIYIVLPVRAAGGCEATATKWDVVSVSSGP